MKSRIAKSSLLVGLFLVFSFSTFATILSPALGPGTASAALNNKADQNSRTILFALAKCLPGHLKDDRTSPTITEELRNSLTNLSEIYTANSDGEDVAVGYEVDSENGNARCNNISLSHLRVINKTPQWLFTQLYPTKDPDKLGVYERAEGKAFENKVKSLASQIKSEASATGPISKNERERRLAVAFLQCNTEATGSANASDVREYNGIKYTRIKDGPEKISVGYDMEPRDGKYECNTLLKWDDKAEMERALRNYGRDAQLAANASGAGSGEEIDIGCTYSINPLTWVVCPVIDGFEAMVNGLDNIITSQLSVGSPGNSDNPNQIFCDRNSSDFKQCDAYRAAWVSFRNIALGLLLIIGLAVIISEMAGFEFISAYTLKKMLPRIVVAALALTLSWQLMDFFVQLSNALGYGVRYLIYQPFLNAGFDQARISGGGATAIAFLTFVTGGALGIFGLLSFAATGALAVLVAFLTLMIRELVIISLVIIAPVAIILYVMPNTEKWYKMWWETFAKALMMFPMIAALIASGRVFAAVVTSGADNDPFRQILGFAAYFAPYFMIPMTFKYSGAAMAAIGGAIDNNGFTNMGRKGLQKYRARQYQEHGGRKVEAANRRIMSKRNSINSALMNAASNENRSWATRRALGGFARATAGYNMAARNSAKQAEVGKEIQDIIATGDDTQIRALMADRRNSTEANGRKQTLSDGTIQYKSLGGKWVNESDVIAAEKRWGNDDFAKQAALTHEMKKADAIEDVQGIKENYSSWAGSTGMSDNAAGGAWIGAAYTNQDAHLELKHTDWRTGRMSDKGAKSFLSEAYEKRGNYFLSNQHASTIRQIAEASDIASAAGDTAAADQARDIAKSFVTEYGGGLAAGGTEEEQQRALRQQQAAAAAGGATAGREATIRTTSSGSAHNQQEVREVARRLGVLQESPANTDTRSSGPHPGGPRTS